MSEAVLGVWLKTALAEVRLKSIFQLRERGGEVEEGE